MCIDGTYYKWRQSQGYKNPEMCLSNNIYNNSHVFIYALFLRLNGQGKYCFSTDF